METRAGSKRSSEDVVSDESAKRRVTLLPTEIHSTADAKLPSDDDVLLVYPFPADQKLIDQAADGLHEPASYDIEQEDSASVWSEEETEEGDEESADSFTLDARDEAGRGDRAAPGNDSFGNKSRSAQPVTLRVSDVKKLEPGKDLNAALIDFWMQWISRHEDQSKVLFCPANFYSELVDTGIGAGVAWTVEDNIDVFQKKFIFIPINKNLQWSLCVVVNPSYIEQHNAWAKDGYDETKGFDEDAPMPFLLFFDALKAHQKVWVAWNIRKWLNAEWKRLGKGKTEAPFQRGMVIFSPKVPYQDQDNCGDGGVFVSRYAYAMYLLRKKIFTYKEVDAFCDRGPRFEEIITCADEFTFEMPEIARLRDEIRMLIERLSKIYVSWKKQAVNLHNEAVADHLMEEESAADNEDEETSVPNLVKKDLWSDNTGTVAAALSKLAEASMTTARRGWETKEMILKIGGQATFVGAMEKHSSCVDVQKQGCRALQNASAQNLELSSAVSEICGIETVVNCMQNFRHEKGIQVAACGALQNLVWSNHENAEQLIEHGGIFVLVGAMKAFPEEPRLQRWACGALAALCQESPKNRKLVKYAGGVAAIGAALAKHDGNEDVQERARLAMKRLL